MEQKRVSFTSNDLPVLLGLLAVLMMIVLSILAGFGILFPGVAYGIVKIVLLGLPIAGGIVAYAYNKNLMSFEVLFNVVILAFAMLAF